MDLARRDIFVAFVLALGSMFFLSPFFSEIDLFYFAPFLVIFLYQYHLTACLWVAMLCGLCMDLLLDHHFGIFAIIYVLATMILCRQKRHFFSDRISTLPVMSGVFSLVAITVLFLMSGGEKSEISFASLFSGLFWLFFNNAIYGLIVFVFPFMLLHRRRRHAWKG